MHPMQAEVGRRFLLRLLAGLQSGLVGALILGLWFVAWSRFSGHSAHTFPNLLSWVFYGVDSLTPYFGFHTCAGWALHGVLCMGLGMIVAALARPHWGIVRHSLLGLVVAILWWQAGNQLIWQKLDPPFALYSSTQPFFLGAYILYGCCLGLIPLFARPLERDFLVP
ncbi:MAG: hypothetical protein MUC42_01515 [Bryobacter sp.]|jgi:hypothetical protein|nr:hypothetical protein [Bryobacter sp.]